MFVKASLRMGGKTRGRVLTLLIRPLLHQALRLNSSRALSSKWARVDFQRGKILIREGRVLGKTDIPKTTGSLLDIDMLPRGAGR